MLPFIVVFSAILIFFLLMMWALYFCKYKKRQSSCCQSADSKMSGTDGNSCGCCCDHSDCDENG